MLEDGLRPDELALQPPCGAGQDQLGLETELLPQFVPPLLGQCGAAQHGQAACLAELQQLLGDEPGLDGLTDADVIGDEEAHDILTQSEQERHELVGAWLDGDARQ